MAIAFVSNQRFYDTIYQERYMGLPDDNERGYRDGSPLTFAHQDSGVERRRLAGRWAQAYQIAGVVEGRWMERDEEADWVADEEPHAGEDNLFGSGLHVSREPYL